MTSSKLLLYKRLLSTLLSQIVIIMIFSWVKTNPYHRHLHQKKVLSLHFFFSIRVSFTDTDNLQDSGGKEGTIFYSTLPLPPAHEHSDIYLQLCMWDDYHIFLIAPLVFTRLLLDDIYHLIELPFDWLMMWRLFLFVYVMICFQLFCYSNFRMETGGLELASTITLVLKANRLTKCVSHPKKSTWEEDKI